MQLRPTVLLAVSNRSGFLQAYYERDGATGVWIPGQSAHDLGTHVDLEIAFAEEQIVLHSRGVVRAKRPLDRANLRAGIGIDFLPSETKTRDLILAFAKGQTELVRRKSRRLPVVMDVEVDAPNSHTVGTTENISRDGALIAHASPLMLGAVLPLTLKPQGYDDPIAVRAEVRWRRADARPAVGVRFIFESPSSMSELNSLIEALRARLMT